MFVLTLCCIVWCAVLEGFFNLRGSDIDYNPVFFAYAIIGLDSVR